VKNFCLKTRSCGAFNPFAWGHNTIVSLLTVGLLINQIYHANFGCDQVKCLLSVNPSFMQCSAILLEHVNFHMPFITGAKHFQTGTFCWKNCRFMLLIVLVCF
jgi:hypothetical protein